MLLKTCCFIFGLFSDLQGARTSQYPSVIVPHGSIREIKITYFSSRHDCQWFINEKKERKKESGIQSAAGDKGQSVYLSDVRLYLILSTVSPSVCLCVMEVSEVSCAAIPVWRRSVIIYHSCQNNRHPSREKERQRTCLRRRVVGPQHGGTTHKHLHKVFLWSVTADECVLLFEGTFYLCRYRFGFIRWWWWWWWPH